MCGALFIIELHHAILKSKPKKTTSINKRISAIDRKSIFASGLTLLHAMNENTL